jgi:hypothetical protein
MAQEIYEALVREDCREHIQRAQDFSARAEFEVVLEERDRIAVLWAMGACAMNNHEYEMAFTAAGRGIELAPDLPPLQILRFVSSMALDRHAETFAAFDVLAATVPEAMRMLETEHVQRLLRTARELDDTGERQLAFYETLRQIGYAPQPPHTDEFLRMGHARLLLERGRLEEARDLLAAVLDVDLLATMRIERLFDPLREDPEFEARLDLRVAVERDIERARATVEAQPDLLEAVLKLTRGLSTALRAEEALAIVEAALGQLQSDAQAFRDADDYRPWILNEKGYLLYRLDRPEEGYETLREAAGMAERGEQNVSQVINLANYLIREGRGVEALALVAEAGQASPYGRAWIEAVRSCAGVLVDDETLRDEGLAYLNEHEADNPAALSRALLCSNDMEGAAALMVRRLADANQRTNALLALQFHPPSPSDTLSFQRLLKERFDRLREREDVRTAVDLVGRIEVMPIDIGGGT